MNKARLEWILSGLNRYKLSPSEDQFVRSIQQAFHEKNMLSEKEEERLEGFYREKQRLVADRNFFTPKLEGVSKQRKFRKWRSKRGY